MVAILEVKPESLFSNNTIMPHTIRKQRPALPKRISDEVVTPAYNYIAALPSTKGKDKTMAALNVWFNVPEDKLERIVKITNLLHNASLMLDDIQDGSELRRGQPAAHCVFGLGQTINSAGHAIHLALKEVIQFHDPESLAIFTEEIEHLYIGQGNDLYWTSNMLCPSVEEYWAMNDAKTGGMFRLFSRLMQQHATTARNLDISHLLTIVGRHFQLRDDYLSLGSTEYTATKGFCEDLDEGKFSLPLIHLIDNRANDPLLRNMLMHRRVEGKQSLGNKHTILKMMKECGSLDYALQTIHDLQAEIECEVCRIEEKTATPNPLMRLILKCLEV